MLQIALWLLAPPLAGLFVIAAAVLSLWLNINFIDVLHGFDSLLKSFLLWLLVTFGIALGRADADVGGGRLASGMSPMYDVNAIRRDFPILSREVNGKPLVYLDNGASAQKPQVVIDAVTRGLFARNTPTCTAACTTCRTSRPSSTRPCAARSRAS